MSQQENIEQQTVSSLGVLDNVILASNNTFDEANWQFTDSFERSNYFYLQKK